MARGMGENRTGKMGAERERRADVLDSITRQAFYTRDINMRPG